MYIIKRKLIKMKTEKLVLKLLFTFKNVYITTVFREIILELRAHETFENQGLIMETNSNRARNRYKYKI